MARSKHWHRLALHVAAGAIGAVTAASAAIAQVKTGLDVPPDVDLDAQFLDLGDLDMPTRPAGSRPDDKSAVAPLPVKPSAPDMRLEWVGVGNGVAAGQQGQTPSPCPPTTACASSCGHQLPLAYWLSSTRRARAILVPPRCRSANRSRRRLPACRCCRDCPSIRALRGGSTSRTQARVVTQVAASSTCAWRRRSPSALGGSRQASA